MDFSVRVSGDKEFVNQIKENVLSVKRKLSKEMRSMAEFEVKSSLEAVNAKASSALINSITSEVSFAASRNFLVKISSDQVYAENVELGRRAGSKPPPISAIYQWMQIKGIEGSYDVAFLIARKIGSQGIEGKHPFELAVARIQEQLPALIDNFLGGLKDKK